MGFTKLQNLVRISQIKTYANKKSGLVVALPARTFLYFIRT